MPKAINQKLICIVGPTATGKTALAVKLAKEVPSSLISADSRQVYRGMDIVTGKDHPAGMTLSGIDLVDPDQDCSVAVWQHSIAPNLNSPSLPIVVGGTGLYVKSLTHGIETIGVPVNKKLRGELSNMNVNYLKKFLQKISPLRLNNMNNSDRNNPRRLIRAIEVSLSNNHVPNTLSERPDTLIIGLHISDPSVYESKIRERVISRIDGGAIEETVGLLAKYPPTLPSMSALGYKHIISFIKGEISKDLLIDNWTRDELAYSKRQMTWFNKMPNINWFEVQDGQTLSQVAELFKNWYHRL